MNAPLLPNRSKARAGQLAGTIDIQDHIEVWLEATRLIELGARANLISQLTGLPGASVRRLYRQMTGRASPSGQMAYNDTWYTQNNLRMLHTSLAWRHQRQFQAQMERPAGVLIATFEAYRCLVQLPLLDIGRVAFVPHLLATGTWRAYACQYCACAYIAPLTEMEHVCPGCRLHRRYRCGQCATPLNVTPFGRPRAHCPRCGARIGQPVH
jgi:CRISPR/Cas system CSM-associated protein Csm2 small subunit